MTNNAHTTSTNHAQIEPLQADPKRVGVRATVAEGVPRVAKLVLALGRLAVALAGQAARRHEKATLYSSGTVQHLERRHREPASCRRVRSRCAPFDAADRAEPEARQLALAMRFLQLRTGPIFCDSVFAVLSVEMRRFSFAPSHVS